MSPHWLTVAFLAASCAAFAQQQTGVISPSPEAPTDFRFYRVDPATGKLTPLEKTRTVMEGSRFSYTMYLPGPASAAVFPADEKQVFVIRLIGGYRSKPPTLEDKQKHHPELERLRVGQNGRYATKQFVPLDVGTYGEVLKLVDDRGYDWQTRTFTFTPQTPLPPGNYAFSPIGLLMPWTSAGSAPPVVDGYAFTIISGGRHTDSSSQPSAPAEPAASDQTVRLKKLKELHDGGLITDADYEKKKDEILKGL